MIWSTFMTSRVLPMMWAKTKVVSREHIYLHEIGGPCEIQEVLYIIEMRDVTLYYSPSRKSTLARVRLFWSATCRDIFTVSCVWYHVTHKTSTSANIRVILGVILTTSPGSLWHYCTIKRSIYPQLTWSSAKNNIRTILHALTLSSGS